MMNIVFGVTSAKKFAHQMLSYLNSLKMVIKFITITHIYVFTAVIVFVLALRVVMLFGKVKKKEYLLHVKMLLTITGLFGRKKQKKDEKIIKKLKNLKKVYNYTKI